MFVATEHSLRYVDVLWLYYTLPLEWLVINLINYLNNLVALKAMISCYVFV